MSGFLSSYLSDMLCVCINDTDPAPEEPSDPAVDDTTASKGDSAIDQDIQSIRSDGKARSDVSNSSAKSTAAAAAAAVDCFEEGQHAQEGEDYTQAISFYKRAVELNPKYIEAHSNLGDVFTLCKNAPAAEKHFKMVVALDPFNYKTMYKLGYLYLNDLKRSADSVKMFQSCLDINPSDADALVSLGLAHMETGQHEDAVRCFQELLAENPKDIVARFNLGNAFLDSGAYGDAVAEYMKVLEMQKTHVDASFNMAIAYQHMAKVPDISTETRLRYLSCAMRVYVQISGWKDTISRQFVVEALKGVESVRREQTKYSNSRVADSTGTGTGTGGTISARSRSGSSGPPPAPAAATSSADTDAAAAKANLAESMSVESPSEAKKLEPELVSAIKGEAQKPN